MGIVPAVHGVQAGTPAGSEEAPLVEGQGNKATAEAFKQYARVVNNCWVLYNGIEKRAIGVQTVTVDWLGAEERKKAAIRAAEADNKLGPYEKEQARHEAAKRFCIETGQEILTPAATGYLFGKSLARVHAARRGNPAEAVEFSLHFGSPNGDAVHMIRLSWARTVWAEPADYAQRLETVRSNGHVMGLANGGQRLILSPTKIYSTPDPIDQTAASAGEEKTVGRGEADLE